MYPIRNKLKGKNKRTGLMKLGKYVPRKVYPKDENKKRYPGL
jgi:hypothetical protein